MNRNKRKKNFINTGNFVFFFCLFIQQQFCSGQSVENKILFNHFSSQHNLSQTIVEDIIQDKKGYLWFGTRNGLIKYDGYTFTTYQHEPSDKNSLPDNWVRNLCADNDGNIWYTNDDMLLICFDAHTEKFISFPQYDEQKYSDSTISASEIALAPDGRLWFACGGYGVAMYDPASKKFSHQLDLPADSSCDNDAHAVMFDHSGLLWIATHTCLYSYNIKNKKLTLALQSEKDKIRFGSFIITMMEDRRGRIWISAVGEGVIRYNPVTNETIFYMHTAGDPSSLCNNYIQSIYEDRDETIWLGGYGEGLSRFQPETDNFFTIQANSSDEYGLSSENVLKIFQDRSGMLWLGTTGGGINTAALNEKIFHACQSYSNDYRFRCPISLIKDHEGKIWMGTFGAGIQLLNSATGNFTSYKFPGLSGTDKAFNNAMGLFEDSNDTIWFAGTFEGLHYLNRQRKTFTTVHSFRNTRDSTRFNISNCITEDKSKRLWIGTLSGLHNYNLLTKKYSESYKLFSDTNDLSYDYIFALYCDDEGMLWIGGQFYGVTVMNTFTGQLKKFRHDERNQHSLSYNSVTCFYDDHKGKIFIGTNGGGLNVFDKKTEQFICYTIKDGLPDNNVKAILPEDGKSLWLSTSNGLCRISFQPSAGEKPNALCRNYNMSDGLPSNESQGGAVKGDDGTFYFCTNGGLVAFKPEELKENQLVPPVIITSLYVLNNIVTVNDTSGILKLPVDETKEITLTYNQNVFSFSFAAFNFAHPEKNKFAYMLEGFDKNWIYTDAFKRFATYTHLDAGEYIFKVKASNNDGIWNETPAEIKVIILPPFWKTWWFKLLCFITGGCIVSLIVNSRLQKLRDIKRIRNKIASDLHDDLGATLSSISIMSEIVKQQTKNVSPQSSAMLEKIGISSRSMIESVNDMVWAINPKNDTFENIINRMKTFASEILSAKDINFNFDFDKDLLKSKMKMDARKNFYLIFKEAINNIAKYSGAVNAFINLDQSENLLRMVIRDDGRGFEFESVKRGNGLNNMLQRAEDMKALLTIESSVGEGTRIKLEFKNKEE